MMRIWYSLAAWPMAGWMARVHWNGDEARAKSIVFGAPTFYVFGFFTAKLVHMGITRITRGRSHYASHVGDRLLVSSGEDGCSLQ